MKVITDPNQIDKKKWREFVYNHPHGNIFQTPEMYDVYKKTKNYEPVFVSIIDDNRIEAILLAVIQKESYSLLSFLTTRSIITGGPLVKNNNPDTLNFILKEYQKKIRRKAIYTQFRNLWDWSKEEKDILSNNGYNYEEHLDILIDLRKQKDDLLMEMHKGRRKNIKRAERIPLVFSETKNISDFENCLKLIKETYKKVKMPCPDLTLFYSAFNTLSKECCIRNFIVKYQNEIIGCRFVLCYNKLIYDWFAGTDEKHQDKYPNDFLIWKILQWAKENNYSTFDFGGAGKPNEPYGVREYKLKFGGDMVEYGRFIKIYNPFLFKIGKLGITILKKLK